MSLRGDDWAGRIGGGGPRRFVARAWKRFLRPWLRPVGGVFPLTMTGVAFLAVFGLAVWFQGVLHLDLVLLVAGSAGGLMILALLGCTSTGAFFFFLASRRATTPGALDLETRQPQPTGYRARYPRWIPLTVAGWTWVDDGGGETPATVLLEKRKGEIAETVAPSRRCVVTRVVRRFAVRDVFGLTEISWRRAEAVNLRVLPHRGLLAQMPPPVGMADGDDLPDTSAAPLGDRVDMRQYAPGDPIRMMLWKVYAHSGRLMVRTPERSVAERRKGCGYLMVGTAANAAEADDATAAVARVAVERGLLGDDWRFGADGVPRRAADTDAALEVLARSGGAGGDAEGDAFREFLSQMRHEGYQFCVLFLPPDPRAWARASRQVAVAGPMRIQTLTGVEAIRLEHKESRGAAWRVARWFVRQNEVAGPTLEDLRQMAAAAPGPGVASGVVERGTGNLFQDILGRRP